MESLNAAKIIEECKMSGEEVVNIVAAHGEDQFIHVVDIEEFAANHDRLVEENADLIAVLSNAIAGWDYEEVAHHCGVDAETASRVIELLNK